MLLVKSNTFGTMLNTQNMQETNLYLNNPYMCWLDKATASNKNLLATLRQTPDDPHSGRGLRLGTNELDEHRAISCRPPITNIRVRSQAISCEICDGQRRETTCLKRECDKRDYKRIG
jgi:hypothetical protein